MMRSGLFSRHARREQVYRQPTVVPVGCPKALAADAAIADEVTPVVVHRLAKLAAGTIALRRRAVVAGLLIAAWTTLVVALAVEGLLVADGAAAQSAGSGTDDGARGIAGDGTADDGTASGADQTVLLSQGSGASAQKQDGSQREDGEDGTHD